MKTTLQSHFARSFLGLAESFAKEVRYSVGIPTDTWIATLPIRCVAGCFQETVLKRRATHHSRQVQVARRRGRAPGDPIVEGGLGTRGAGRGAPGEGVRSRPAPAAAAVAVAVAVVVVAGPGEQRGREGGPLGQPRGVRDARRREAPVHDARRVPLRVDRVSPRRHRDRDGGTVAVREEGYDGRWGGK